MIGAQWSLFYAEDPTEEAVVHLEILRLLHTALEKMSATFLEARCSELRKQSVQKAKDLLREEAAKRRRRQ